MADRPVRSSHDRSPGPRHKCLADSCEALVSSRMAFCRPDWRRVPYPLRAAVWAAWRDGAGQGSRAHLEALLQARRALRDRAPAPLQPRLA
jgi:hypothetical protein